MLPFSINSGRGSFWRLIQDPQVRVGLYTWLLIGGLCVFLANAVAAGF